MPNILGFGDVENVVRLISPHALYISARTEDKYSRGAQYICNYAKDDFPVDQLQCKLWGGGHVLRRK